jgi:DNA polymerase
MTRTLFIDSETFSDVPIAHGTHKYAERAEVMIVTYAFDDEPVQTLEFPAHQDVQDLLDEADVVVGHNIGNFDSVVFWHALNVEVDLRKTFDTMACALSHSLPGSLGKLCDVMGIKGEDAKDADGKKLIHLFCKPQPKRNKLRRATAHTHPDEWAAFLAYAGRDITSMRLLYQKLPRWNYDIGKSEHNLWLLDQRINRRGVRIDMALAAAAIEACTEEKARLADRAQELSYGEVGAATQRDALLRHVLEWYGIELPNLLKGTVERLIDEADLPEPVRELLVIRLSASATSVAKYKRLLEATSSDERLRGTLQYCGAARTGRWAGRLFQPQNLPRPTLKQPAIDDAIVMFKAGMGDDLPDVIEAAQSCVRGSLIAAEGKRFVVADLANIEGRVLAWLAGEEWKLDAFRDYDAGAGPDLYKLAYSRSFNVPVADITKDDPRRQIGKVQELALGYQGAAGAFGSMAALYGVNLPDDEILRIVKAWRKAHPRTVSFWYDMEDAARAAVAQPGVVHKVGMLAWRRDGGWLKLRLPSERLLCYPTPKVEWVKSPCPACGGDGKVSEKEVQVSDTLAKCDRCDGKGTISKNQLTYAGIDQFTRQWSRIKTYGGKLVENAVQAVARDVIAAGVTAADRAGYDVLLSVHDEIITEAPDEPVYTLEGLEHAMTSQIGWAAGLPLAAEGFEAGRYRK